MTPLTILLLFLAALVVTLASYISRVYSEFGKILSREVQDNIDAWEEKVEPHLGLSREHAAISAAVLQQMALGMIALVFGAVLFDRGPHLGRPSYARDCAGRPRCHSRRRLLQSGFAHGCSSISPRAAGLRACCGLSGFCSGSSRPSRSLSASSTPSRRSPSKPPNPQEEAAVNVEALLEAGQEEGILEETDRDLVRSAVEFGDKLVREVMTPRPRVFAVPEVITLEEFLEQLREHNFSRVPVFSGSLDNITGIAFAHDLLQITDEEARTRTVADIERPAAFVPETKRGYELLREMQREKQHMRIVIDEYGGVAGLVTIEDLLEQIVGDIKDEHETDTPVEDPQREAGGSWLVPGSFPVDQLVDLFGEPAEIDDGYEATTLGGLVSEIEGRIPLRGEVVMLDHAGLRIEVVASTDRRVERLRVFPPHIETAAAQAS